MNDLFLSRKHVSFSRYSDFCVFSESANSKVCEVIIDITAHLDVTYSIIPLESSVVFKYNWSDISATFDKHFQNLFSSIQDIFRFSLNDKIVQTFKKSEKPQTHHFWFLINCSRLVN